MARRVLIVGEPGSGKSTSVSQLNPKETFIINVAGKDLPFNHKGYEYCNQDPSVPPTKGNLIETSDADHIIKVMRFVSNERPDIKNIIIDDWQYVSAEEFMNKIDVKGFDKFNKMGKHVWDMANIPKSLREDLTVFYLTHSETVRDEISGVYKSKAKTLGKVVDNVVTLEGMFSIVLFTDSKKTKDNKITKYFITNSDNTTTAKSPRGMFEEIEVPNDLNYVKEQIDEFYK